MWARKRHRGGGGLAVPGPFNRIARAGGQKVTIRTRKRPLFRLGSGHCENFFNGSSRFSADSVNRSGKTGRVDRVAAELAVERRAKLAGEAVDDPFELLLGDVVASPSGTSTGLAMVSARSARSSRRSEISTGSSGWRSIANSTISVTRKATATATSWVVEGASRSSSIRMPRALVGRAGAQVGGQLGQQRPQRDPAILLHLGIMVAVDDRQRVDPPADRRIGGLGLRRWRAAAMDVEQRGDDLEVVLHPVMDFADQPPLAFERVEPSALGAFDPVDRALEGLAQIAGFRSPAPSFVGRLEPSSPG